MSISTLPKKLQLKTGQRAVIINSPSGYLNTLTPLPEGVEVVETLEPEGQFDFVQLFIKNMAELQQFLPVAIQAIRPDALLWIAYPKGGIKAGTDVNRDILWATVSEHNLSGVALVSLDDVWSAMRFRPSEQVRQRLARS